MADPGFSGTEPAQTGIRGSTMDAYASGRTKRDWLAFDCSGYLLTKILLAIVVLGETFRRGVKLRDDLEGLV